MAEQIARDVVDQSSSVGDQSPSDVHAHTAIHHPTRGVVVDAETRGEGDGGELEQDNHSETGPTDYSSAKHQNNVCISTKHPVSDHPDDMLEQNLPEEAEPHHVEAVTQTDKTNDSDLDGTLSPSRSVEDISAATSDTDARRVDPMSAPEASKIQDNSNAAKRATTFKPVSFAKYSAVKATGISFATKNSGDKALSSSTNASAGSLHPGSRPRLVAKSTNGLRDNTAKLFNQGGRTTAGEPDPMQVWNKNRPTAPSSTKHLTDEELKQQYGIHMTSRIEADGESKEAKWADIDDDEDDWAPESIEWADGTKVTLNQASSAPGPQQKIQPDEISEEQPSETRISKPREPQFISSVGPNATVLKVGASAERQQAQKASSSQRGTSEKAAPATVKSPAPMPAKSPWASLPPIDKLPPVTTNHETAVPRQARPDQVPSAGPSPSMASAASPAKEISADDFNRSWRDSQPAQPRELFMPNSGRYEAVGESRRKSFRNDQNFRAPALLQRPSPSDQHAPAEPSPAFQTSRIGADQERGPWDKRRASSIQSGGSSQQGRRMSFAKAFDAPTHPSEAPQFHGGSSQAGASDMLTTSRGVHIQQNASVAPQTPIGDLPGPTSDIDVIAEQKRLMQESARLAVQRRREEEQKEEVARKERIRLKLEQLGPPPDQKTKGQESGPAVAGKSDEPAMQISSPPKPPVPEPTGEPKQYGMMKVYHPDNVKKLSSLAEKPEISTETKVQDEEQRQIPEPSRSPKAVTNGLKAGAEMNTDTPSREADNDVVSSEGDLQTWKSNLTTTEPLQGWNSRNQHANPAKANLWAPPNRDNALGNGTFDQGLTGLSTRDLSVRNSSPQHTWLNGALPSHDLSPKLPAMRGMAPQDTYATAPFAPSEQKPIAANSEADSVRPVGNPLPIGPPQTNVGSQRWQQVSNSRVPKNGVAAWNNFHAVAAREDRAEHERYQRDHAAKLEEEAKTGARKGPQYNFSETWKQVEIGDQSGDRQITSVARASMNSPFPAAIPYSAPGAGFSSDRAANGLPIRGSRFFPTEARRAVTYSHPTLSRSPSPPPAEGLGSPHPVYGGNTKRPIINFPVPKAVVKLPKPQEKPSPTPTPPAPPRTFAAAVAAQPPPPPPETPSARVVSQPLTSAADWQNRINDLFGRKSPPKRQVVAVASSSREPLDIVPGNVAAAVSLPPSGPGLSKDTGKITSKDVEEEEDLFEDREAASTPSVHVPRDVPESVKRPARTPQLRQRNRQSKQEVDAVSVHFFDFPDDSKRGARGKETVYFVHLPGTAKSTRKTMLSKDVGTGGFVSKGAKGQHLNGGNYKNKRGGVPKSRESSSGSFQASSSSSNNKVTNNNHIHNNSNYTSNARSSPAINGSVPTPRSGFSSHNSNSHHGGWKGGHTTNSAGLAH